jgi:nucleotide-binding universal stress UspA family protein
MKNALVPIDGSPAALRALSYALDELRNRADVQVHVLNVRAPMVEPWPGQLVSPDMISAELRLEGGKILARAETEARAANVPCVAHVSIGAAAEEITAYATRHGCDAIVMGTRGMRALAGLVLGSVAHKVVHLANVPVVLVK